MVSSQYTDKTGYTIIGNATVSGNIKTKDFTSLQTKLQELKDKIQKNNEIISNYTNELSKLNSAFVQIPTPPFIPKDLYSTDFLVVHENDIHLFVTNSSQGDVNQAYFFSTLQNVWKMTGTSVPSFGAGVFVDGVGLFDSSFLFIINSQSAVWRYNLTHWKSDFAEQGIYTASTKSITARYGRHLLVFGGLDSQKNALNQLVLIDNSGYSSITVPRQFQQLMYDGSVAVVNDVAYIFPNFFNFNSTIYVRPLYGVGENKDVTPTNSIAFPPRFASCTFTFKNEIYLFGGKGSQQYYGELLKYDIASNSFINITTVSNIPSPRSHSKCVVCGEFLYLFGGVMNETKYNDFYKLKLE
jgi:hypothetical protein